MRLQHVTQRPKQHRQSVTSLVRICLWPQQFNQQFPGGCLPRTIRSSIGPVPSTIARRRWVLACHRGSLEMPRVSG
jgi:hypothetical protein